MYLLVLKCAVFLCVLTTTEAVQGSVSPWPKDNVFPQPLGKEIIGQTVIAHRRTPAEREVDRLAWEIGYYRQWFANTQGRTPPTQELWSKYIAAIQRLSGYSDKALSYWTSLQDQFTPQQNNQPAAALNPQLPHQPMPADHGASPQVAAEESEKEEPAEEFSQIGNGEALSQPQAQDTNLSPQGMLDYIATHEEPKQTIADAVLNSLEEDEEAQAELDKKAKAELDNTASTGDGTSLSIHSSFVFLSGLITLVI